MHRVLPKSADPFGLARFDLPLRAAIERVFASIERREVAAAASRRVEEDLPSQCLKRCRQIAHLIDLRDRGAVPPTFLASSVWICRD